MENTTNSKVAMALIASIAVGAATWYFMNSKNGKQHWDTLLEVAKDITEKFRKASENSAENMSNNIFNPSSILKGGSKNWS